MLIYKHDEPGFVLTAYHGENPVAWIAETPQGWELHTYVSINTYDTFTEVQDELEMLFG